jgi:hypothetical protein
MPGSCKRYLAVCVANAVVDAQSSVQKAAVLQKALH